MKNKDLLRYAVLPPVLLNVWGIVLYLPYYILYYAKREWVSFITPGQITFINYVFLMMVEWVLAITILRRLKRDGVPLRQIIARNGRPLSFRLLPAIGLVVGANLLWGVYMALTSLLYGATITNSYIGLASWQRFLIILATPATAAFCEELIWRAIIPLQMEARHYGLGRIVALSSLSFALIHGVFLVDKLIITFLLGVIFTLYFLKERNLVPSIVAHWLLDVGSLGWLLLR